MLGPSLRARAWTQSQEEEEEDPSARSQPMLHVIVRELPPYANKHVFLVRPAAAFGGCLHACSRVRRLGPVSTGFHRKRSLRWQGLSFDRRHILGDAYMLVRHHACSRTGVVYVDICSIYHVYQIGYKIIGTVHYVKNQWVT